MNSQSIRVNQALTSTNQIIRTYDVVWEHYRRCQLVNQTHAEDSREKRENIFSIEKSLQCRYLLFFQWRKTLQFWYNWRYGSYANLFRSPYYYFPTNSHFSCCLDARRTPLWFCHKGIIWSHGKMDSLWSADLAKYVCLIQLLWGGGFIKQSTHWLLCDPLQPMFTHNTFLRLSSRRFVRLSLDQASLFCLCFTPPNSWNSIKKMKFTVHIPSSQLNCRGSQRIHDMFKLTMRLKRGRTGPRPSCPALSAPPPASCCCTAAECFLHRTSPGPSWRWSMSLPAGL